VKGSTLLAPLQSIQEKQSYLEALASELIIIEISNRLLKCKSILSYLVKDNLSLHFSLV